ncbi:MAG: helix-turn-helix domain-containing protein, partial [Acidobacteria bacterium]
MPIRTRGFDYGIQVYQGRRGCMSRNRPPQARVGAKLKKARERRGISLRQVADSTKISVFVLQALERDDISNLPGGVVGRGFVRSFAAAVNLDPEAIVAEFVAQFPNGSVNDGYPAASRIDGNEVPDARPSEAPFKMRWSEPSTLLRRVAVGALPAVLIAYFAFAPVKPWSQWAAIQNRVATAAANLADNVIRAAGSDESAVQMPRPAQPSAQPPARLPAQPAAPDVPVTDTAKAESVPPPVAPTAVPPAMPPASEPPAAVATAPAVVVTETPSANSQSTAGEDREKAPDAGVPVDEPLRVVLSATSPSWVIASVDGKRTVNRLLEVGEQETLEATRELV